MKKTQTMIEAVQDCYAALLTATTKWSEYRRLAGEVGIRTEPLPEVAEAANVCVAHAEKLAKRKEDIQKALYGTGILQANIYSADGTRSRKAVLARPDAKHDTPYLSKAAHAALVTILGDGLVTDAPFSIAVEQSTITVNPKGE